MEEEESELSSSSSSYSSSEDESVGEEEDEDSEEEPPVGSRSGGPEQRSGERGRRKRRRKLVGRRRELRSKYESVKDFNPEARSAQTEEIERIRRLELQRSLQVGTPTVPRVVTPGEAGGELNSLLGSGAVFRNLAEDEEERERVVDAIVISSDSEEGDEEEEEERERLRRGEAGRLGEGGREVKAEPVEDVKEKKLGRYDVVGKERGDQVVINLGHPPDEEDVTLAPQIARIIKPHQVGERKERDRETETERERERETERESERERETERQRERVRETERERERERENYSHRRRLEEFVSSTTTSSRV